MCSHDDGEWIRDEWTYSCTWIRSRAMSRSIHEELILKNHHITSRSLKTTILLPLASFFPETLAIAAIKLLPSRAPPHPVEQVWLTTSSSVSYPTKESSRHAVNRPHKRRLPHLRPIEWPRCTTIEWPRWTYVHIWLHRNLRIAMYGDHGE
jgi:hypothetical protein